MEPFSPSFTPFAPFAYFLLRGSFRGFLLFLSSRSLLRNVVIGPSSCRFLARARYRLFLLLVYASCRTPRTFGLLPNSHLIYFHVFVPFIILVRYLMTRIVWNENAIIYFLVEIIRFLLFYTHLYKIQRSKKEFRKYFISRDNERSDLLSKFDWFRSEYNYANACSTRNIKRSTESAQRMISHKWIILITLRRILLFEIHF